MDEHAWTGRPGSERNRLSAIGPDRTGPSNGATMPDAGATVGRAPLLAGALDSRSATTSFSCRSTSAFAQLGASVSLSDAAAQPTARNGADPGNRVSRLSRSRNPLQTHQWGWCFTASESALGWA